MRTLRFIGGIIKSFLDDDNFNLAANISFCALLAFIPVSMMMVSIAASFVGGSQDALERIVDFATNGLPVGRDVFEANLQSILDQRSSLGLVGAGFLVFIATLLFSSIERAFDVIFKSERKRNFLHSRLLGILVIFLITFLFALPTMAQILEGAFQRYEFHFPLSEFVSGKIFFLFFAFVAYLMTVVIIPNRKVYLRYAAVGGVIFAIGISVAKFLFRWYMVFSIQRYNIMYGSLTAVVLMIIWIYYLTVTLLLSTEVVAALQRQHLFHRKREKAA